MAVSVSRRRDWDGSQLGVVIAAVAYGCDRQAPDAVVAHGTVAEQRPRWAHETVVVEGRYDRHPLSCARIEDR